MPHDLTFTQVAEYDAGQSGITVIAVLKLVKELVTFEAKIDTDATN